MFGRTAPVVSHIDSCCSDYLNVEHTRSIFLSACQVHLLVLRSPGRHEPLMRECAVTPDVLCCSGGVVEAGGVGRPAERALGTHRVRRQ